ncbi:BadF/BadG/BcrA/BcrD ATPase family protein [Streptomyces chumphonensis]|uniref:N-acetylglucosamine kinase n=1 Tax=Streptomyces chumphonensis TaxID=1214925 RepID=UPI0029653D88|nr:BadF/BadG/BcrA/BcrD ATPase family protein [Streptomyces chumphonensis]
MSRWVLGVDSGGSGLRVALADAVRGRPMSSGPVLATPPVGTGPGGIDAEELAHRVVTAARTLLTGAGACGEPVPAVCVGAAGMASLGEDLRSRLPGVLRAELGTDRLALAADAVTAYAGALGVRPGAVAAMGTGMVALATDLSGWRRADGWGHLLGDCGGGAWIGRAALEAALRAHDGRESGSAALLASAEERFGPVAGLPGRLYPRADRAAVLASFAPEVAACAARDPVAADILRAAAGHVADALAAVCPADDRPAVALTGGLVRLGEPLLGPLRREVADRLPRARLTEPAGDPLAGALLVAARLAGDGVALPADPALLRTV